MRNLRWLVILLAGWAMSLWLLGDGFSYALYDDDPATGRQRGCYTTIEQVLGVKEPTVIRPIEQLLGVALFLGVPIVIAVGGVLLGKRRSEADRKIREGDPVS